MKAVLFRTYGGPLEIVDIPEPAAPDDGAVIRVEATGICRSDWHGWRGHDPDITVPHVPGHEFAGVVHTVGRSVRLWDGDERVTAPFVCGCGTCGPCARGDQQVCERQTQPGFTHDGSFAEYVVVRNADVNLVRLPDSVDSVSAAALGCRFATAYRAVVQQGRPAPGQWVAVYGCGGVGLSAVMIGVASGARVVAVDISPDALDLAAELGAEITISPSTVAPAAGGGGLDDIAMWAARVGAAVREATGGGTSISIDALGSSGTCAASVHSLERRGRHVQVGLLPPALGTPPIPMDRVIGAELEIVGSHGMAAHSYPPMLAAVEAGVLRPDRLITRRIGLDAVAGVLAEMGEAPPTQPGITVATP
ncbi:MAG TPA: zinc-dependent alcohol dehydrogenase family protein [Jiangellaceae bacterium]|nr:zinc-dependent alcohol dehydrogenase family protein [Jiangellaceae bacterium]